MARPRNAPRTTDDAIPTIRIGVVTRNSRLRSRVRSSSATGIPMSRTTIRKKPNGNGWLKVENERRTPLENRMTSLYS